MKNSKIAIGGASASVIFLFLIAFLISGNYSALAQEIKHYYGNVRFLSPDENTLYGETISLVKRTIKPDESKITEEVLQPSQDPGKKFDRYITELSRIESSNTFKVTDNENRFQGTVTFTGEEWKWNEWKYDIQLIDGGKIKGDGRFTEDGIKTQKKYLDKEENETVHIQEEVKLISPEQFDEIYKKITGKE